MRGCSHLHTYANSYLLSYLLSIPVQLPLLQRPMSTQLIELRERRKEQDNISGSKAKGIFQSMNDRSKNLFAFSTQLHGQSEAKLALQVTSNPIVFDTGLAIPILLSWWLSNTAKPSINDQPGQATQTRALGLL